MDLEIQLWTGNGNGTETIMEYTEPKRLTQGIRLFIL